VKNRGKEEEKGKKKKDLHDGSDVLADELILGVTEETHEGLVHELDNSLRVDHCHRVHHRVQDLRLVAVQQGPLAQAKLELDLRVARVGLAVFPVLGTRSGLVRSKQTGAARERVPPRSEA
jgi:hypothetical protein